ncbi:hypothetical protein GGR54DRAFT_620574 [Hypoxylon sp. NC1633]|nr:hypothetical protein GGR54DRAFT_620574 [Hypoxylon sp. NC1633]
MYQCLKPKGSSPLEKRAAEFATSVRVYGIAREYKLSALETLAKREMERLGHGLPVTRLLEAVMNGHLTPAANDIWLHHYLKSLIEPLMETPPMHLINGPLEYSAQTLSVVGILLKIMAELWSEKKQALQLSPGHSVISQRQEEPAAVFSFKEGPASTTEPKLDGTGDLAVKSKKKKKKGKKNAGLWGWGPEAEGKGKLEVPEKTESVKEVRLLAEVDPAEAEGVLPEQQDRKSKEDISPWYLPLDDGEPGILDEQPDQDQKTLFGKSSQPLLNSWNF